MGLEATEKSTPSLWLEAWRRLRRNRPAMFGLSIVGLMFFMALFAPWLAPHSYTQQDLNAVEQGPSLTHPLGTDELGRDVLSRIIWGARSAAFISVTVTAISVTLGILMGALAGYFGGWIDTLIMRLTDLLFAFPGLLFVFFIAATIKPSIVNWVKGLGFTTLVKSGYVDYLVVLVALAAVGWPGLARLVRGQLLSLKEKAFIEAARAIGVSSWRIIVRHLLPNAMAPVIVAISIGMGGVILSEAALSFLGIGLQPPNPSWGAMLYEYSFVYAYWRNRPHLFFTPALLLAGVVFAFNFLGDGLNEALNPQLD